MKDTQGNELAVLCPKPTISLKFIHQDLNKVIIIIYKLVSLDPVQCTSFKWTILVVNVPSY